MHPSAAEMAVDARAQDLRKREGPQWLASNRTAVILASTQSF